MKHYISLAAAMIAAGALAAFTTAQVPQDGVYRFVFGVEETGDGSIPVPASAVCDVNGDYDGEFSYGFLGTTDTSYLDDVPANLPSVPFAIDGFKVVKGQRIVLHDGTDAKGKGIVYGPAASEYLPEGASTHEGRYPIRFSMRSEERGYYAVTCTVANASATANADVTLFSERCHTHAQHLILAPGETKTFAWSVELAPNYFKTPAKYYYDNAINVVVVGENAALAEVSVVKQPVTSENAKVRGEAVGSINVGKTMWLCDDSTGTDQRCDTPYFALQNYAGTGSGLSRWAPANLSIRNQGEGGLSTSAGTHRKSCLLKPGDYLYVQYGHNESGTESFVDNLDTYLADANAAGASLVIVSPVERHNAWNADTETYGRSLQGYAEAGEAWVGEKIAAGARNVAFVDLNKTFNDWQNKEIVRINDINPNISKKAAIEFYYQSSKGGKVDVSHPNNAGADWGAYCFWQNALERVAAGEADGATESQKIQAQVLKGITEGLQNKVGVDGEADNIPWSVTDEIIAAGKAPNAFWDQSVRAGYDYANDAAVAAVDATCEDGVVTLKGVAMRVLNQVNYAKAVIDVEDGAETKRWYSFYNYDASGNTSGDIVVPEVAGFIDEDLAKDDAAEGHFSETLTIPAGAKAYIHFAEASGSTWQVGDGKVLSATYPLEAWGDVLVDDDCSDAATWTTLFGGESTFGAGEDGGIAFSMTGYNSDGQKKNGGFARQFTKGVAEGRIRVQFKAIYTAGELRFALSNKANTSLWPMEGGDVIATLNGEANVAGSKVGTTVSADETPVLQATVNSGEWMDVDMIVDLDTRKVVASVGGSDYGTYKMSGFTHTPHSWFGVTLASEKAHAGAIDDVKITTLAPTPRVDVAAGVNNAAWGTVEINGEESGEASVFAGSDVVLKAVSADEDLYRFVRWEDAEGRVAAETKTLVVENIAEAAAFKAVFAEYAREEMRVKTWDFGEYALEGVAATANTTVEYDGLSIYLVKDDAIGKDGVAWAGVTFSKEAETGSANGRHIEWTAPADGTMEVVFQVGAVDTDKNQKPYLRVVHGDAAMDPYKADASAGDMTPNVNQTLTFNVEAGETYKIYSFYFNRSSTVTVKAIKYTYAPRYCSVAAAVADASAKRGTASVSAGEVIAGKEVVFTAKPVSGAYRFVNWTDADGNEVSTDATYTAAITADTTLYANFAALGEENYTATYGFDRQDETSYSARTIVSNGIFAVQMVSGDSMSADGAVWYKVAVDDKSNLGTSLSETGDHYIQFTAPYNGLVSLTAQVDSIHSKYTAALYIKAAGAASECANSGDANVSMKTANTDYTLSLNVTE
ncbi:MAG: hypothetical protein IJ802_01520, partial [Kiritimatiellae bacterium]|nr:hypothetical protein [Kiritimatiellia bacterium]